MVFNPLGAWESENGSPKTIKDIENFSGLFRLNLKKNNNSGINLVNIFSPVHMLRFFHDKIECLASNPLAVFSLHRLSLQRCGSLVSIQ